jgi:hypothetical protein
LAFTYSALRKWGHRFGHQGTQGLMDHPVPVDRLKSHASWNSTSIASSIKTPWSTVPSIPNGVAASWRPS